MQNWNAQQQTRAFNRALKGCGGAVGAATEETHHNYLLSHPPIHAEHNFLKYKAADDSLLSFT
jgi:hypothetical protein